MTRGVTGFIAAVASVGGRASDLVPGVCDGPGDAKAGSLRLILRVRAASGEIEASIERNPRKLVSPSLPLRDVVRLSGGHHSTPGRWT